MSEGGREGGREGGSERAREGGRREEGGSERMREGGGRREGRRKEGRKGGMTDSISGIECSEDDISCLKQSAWIRIWCVLYHYDNVLWIGCG